MPTALLNNTNAYTSTDSNVKLNDNDYYLLFTYLFSKYEYTYPSTSTSLTVQSKPLSPSDSELTNLCMQISEKSLSEDWENEDDERWNNFGIGLC